MRDCRNPFVSSLTFLIDSILDLSPNPKIEREKEKLPCQAACLLF